MSYRIYMIAGEASGDILGAKLMQALRRRYGEEISFYGIGGQHMCDAGMQSLFPMHELSMMGFFEIIPHIPHLMRRIRQTIDHINSLNPDCVITIDSPGFNCRVAKRLTSRDFPLVHYVAPSVWAYKPKRAKKFARLFDHLLCLLPMEPPYFEKEGLATTFVGHPIMENHTTVASSELEHFCSSYQLNHDHPTLLAMPGSRMTELKRLLPIYYETFIFLKERIPHLQIVIPSTSHLHSTINEHFKSLSFVHVVHGDIPKQCCFALSDVALIKSGTSSLEVSVAGIAMVVAYKVSYLTYLMIKYMIKIPYVSLINIIANQSIIQEYLQDNCTSKKLSDALYNLYENDAAKRHQLDNIKKTLALLQPDAGCAPSEKAAITVAALLTKK